MDNECLGPQYDECIFDNDMCNNCRKRIHNALDGEEWENRYKELKYTAIIIIANSFDFIEFHENGSLEKMKHDNPIRVMEEEQ